MTGNRRSDSAKPEPPGGRVGKACGAKGIEVLRLLAQERAQRQEQQGEEVKQLGFNRCYRLLADVPADAFSRGFLTPQ